jgi:hypothetical protein
MQNDGLHLIIDQLPSHFNNFQVAVYNIQGSLVAISRNTLNMGNNGNIATLNQRVNTGLYLVEIISANGFKYTSKIQISR